MTQPVTNDSGSLAPPPTGAEPSADPFHASLGTLTGEIESRPAIEIEVAPQTRSSRHLYWMIGALCALTIGAAEIGILIRGDSLAAPAPPPEVVAAYQQDPCATRLTAVMDAIAAYTAQHGRPPASLGVLHPGFLAFAPIDPAVNQPYGYEVNGESVALSCPSAAQGAPASPGS
jgi:hypothetical protein